MDKHRHYGGLPLRMFKTLACLIVAMIATSALLGWIDPSLPRQANAHSLEMTSRLSHALVTDGLVTHRQEWSRIEISAGPVGETSALFLTARPERQDYHFLVDLDGRPSRTPHWVRQEDPGGLRSQTVRIQVAREKNGRPMSRSQWHCVRALVSALREAVEAEGDSLPVRLQDEWAAVYGVDPVEAIRVEPPAFNTG